VTDSRDAVDGVKERGVDVLEILGTGGGGGESRGDGGPGPVCKAAALPEPEEIEAFRPLFHSDLMLLTGLREALVRLFALVPSSVESSEKRLDGGLDTASKLLATLSL
jgi:hypothetical protein